MLAGETNALVRHILFWSTTAVSGGVEAHTVSYIFRSLTKPTPNLGSQHSNDRGKSNPQLLPGRLVAGWLGGQ